MIDPNKKLKIPHDELLFIKPDVRKKLFIDICKNYQTVCNVKLVFACLNTNPDLFADYAIVMKARNDDNTRDLILFDVPPIHTNRSTPGYRYCKRNGITKDFFDEGIHSMVVMDRNKFYEFIEFGAHLSRDKNDPEYWKSPDNSDRLLQSLLDLSLRYNPKK